jgi:hypothetical protein
MKEVFWEAWEIWLMEMDGREELRFNEKLILNYSTLFFRTTYKFK